MNATMVRQWIKNRNLDDHQNELLQLAKGHPEAEEKHLDRAVRICLNRWENGLVAILDDNEAVTFSFITALRGTLSPNRIKIKAAFRNAVYNQTLKVRCSSGLSNSNAYHVGHIGKPFAQILTDFLSHRELTLENVNIEYEQVHWTDHPVPQLKDAILRKDWYNFHHENSIMAMQTARDNLANTGILAVPLYSIIDHDE